METVPEERVSERDESVACGCGRWLSALRFGVCSVDQRLEEGQSLRVVYQRATRCVRAAIGSGRRRRKKSTQAGTLPTEDRPQSPGAGHQTKKNNGGKPQTIAIFSDTESNLALQAQTTM